MKRLFLLALFLTLNIATLATAAEDSSVILHQTITTSEAEELDIQLPPELSPGFKSVEVNISGMGQDPNIQEIFFCKNLTGEIHWDNYCPDLEDISETSKTENLLTTKELSEYDPFRHPRETTSTVIFAFAALGLITSAGVFANNLAAKENHATAEKKDEGYIAGLSEGGALLVSSKVGRGDRSGLWSRPLMQRFDKAIANTGNRISGFSPLATRILSDGNYQRSLIGPFSLLIYPIALILGISASVSLHQEALPPSLIFIFLMMFVGILDALAGLLLSLAFVFSILIGGHLNSFDSVMTTAGVTLLAISPALLAGAFRPMRRAVWDFTSLWERGTDYLLASILTGWVIEQIVLGLPGLSGLQLPIADHARTIAVTAVIFVIFRFILEDFAVGLFPARSITLDPQYRERTILQQILSTILKITIFGLVAGKFIGISIELFIGVALFAIPLVMGIFEDRFPKSHAVKKWMPTGIVEMLFMTLIGLFLATLVQDRYPSGRKYILIAFVVLSIPGLVLKILALFGEDGAKDWKITRFGKITYRVLGIVALAFLIYIILSGLLLSNNV